MTQLGVSQKLAISCSTPEIHSWLQLCRGVCVFCESKGAKPVRQSGASTVRQSDVYKLKLIDAMTSALVGNWMEELDGRWKSWTDGTI